MSHDELPPDDPLLPIANVLRREVPIAPGFPERSRGRARRLARRRWLGGSAGAVSVAAVAILVSQQGAPPGRITFALDTSMATGVSLVGDFNDWDSEKLRLQPDGQDRWKVTIDLPPGRYRFAYVTDSGEWLADGSAAPALDDFGRPTSVVTVAEQ